MIVDFAALLISLVSVVVTGVLVGVLGLQQVFGYIKAVKRLFMEALVAFIVIDVIFLVRRFSPLDEATTIIALRLMYSLTLFTAATMGSAATIIYRRPKSSIWRDIYGDAFRFLPFVSYTSILFILFILGWALPLNVALRSCPTSQVDVYVPILESQHIAALSISFVAFLIYPTSIFLLASYAVKNVSLSRDLRMFAAGVIGIALSNYLQVFFLIGCFAEAVDLIRIPCFITLTYVFRRATALQSFRDVEIREYIQMLRRRKLQFQPPSLLLASIAYSRFSGLVSHGLCA